MAKTISNRFFMSLMDDGSTLHGNLVSDTSLVQSWDGSAAMPDWSMQSQTVGRKEQPTIFLTLLNGASTVPATELTDIKWFYRNHAADQEIAFSTTETTITYTDAGGTTQTVTGYLSTTPAGLFLKTTHNGAPALRIVANLASSENLDIDVITFKAAMALDGGGKLDFGVSTQVRITSLTKGGYLGVISFVDGIADITAPGQTVTMQAQLYGGGSSGSVSSFTTRWFLNDETGQGTSGDANNRYSVREGDVTDHATVRCDFYVGSTQVYSAYVGIDDMQDPEYMYITNSIVDANGTSTNDANGNSVQVRKGEKVVATVWVGKRDDDTPDTTWSTFKIQLHDSNGTIVTDVAPNLPDVPTGETDGWRTLTPSVGKASFTVLATTLKSLGKNSMIIIKAEKNE